jgi:hypothetical protein
MFYREGYVNKFFEETKHDGAFPAVRSNYQYALSLTPKPRVAAKYNQAYYIDSGKVRINAYQARILRDTHSKIGESCAKQTRSPSNELVVIKHSRKIAVLPKLKSKAIDFHDLFIGKTEKICLKNITFKKKDAILGTDD